MLKLSTRNLLIVLGVLVLGFVIIRLSSEKERSKSFRRELVQFDTARVTKMVIESPENSIILKKENDQWNLEVDGTSYQATTRSVSSTLKTVNTIKPNRIASRKKERWSDFSVDSAGTRLKVFEGTEKKLDIVLGKFEVEGQRDFYSYVRLWEDEDVYVAKDFMKMSVSTDPATYRQNILARINAEDLNKIIFDYPDSSFSLEISGDRWISESFTVDSAKVASYVSGLSYISSRSFVDAQYKNPSIEVIYQIEGQDDLVLSGYFNEGNWIVRSSANPNEYFLDSELYDKIFKGASAFTN